MNGLETKFALREKIKQNHPKLTPSVYNASIKFRKFWSMGDLLMIIRQSFQIFIPFYFQIFPIPSASSPSPLPRKISTYKVFWGKNNFFVLYHDYCVFCKEFFSFQANPLVFLLETHCVVPENIHTPPTEDHWKFQGGGGGSRAVISEG